MGVAVMARMRLRSVLAQEAIGAVAGLAPALVSLRGSRAAVWHAVEHKSIAAYEAGGADEVENAADHAKEHDRCGSNLVVPLLVTTTVGNTVARKMFGWTLGSRTAVAALSIGAAVEVFAFSARRPEHPLSRAVHGMGHAMQSGFATREPSSSDLLVGQAAMEALLRAEAADRAPDRRGAMSVSVTVVAPAAQEAVWERWTDFAGWPRWNPQCIGATLDGPLAPGTTLELNLRHPRGRDFYTRAAPHGGRATGRDRLGGSEGSACARRPGRR